MKKKVKLIVGAALLAVIAVSVGFFIFKQATTNHKMIKVSGNIEGDEVRISFRVQGQIEELLTDEGMVVSMGDTVARLKTDELYKIKKEQEAALKTALYQYTLNKADYERAEALYRAGSYSAQKRDLAKTRSDASRSDVEHLRASLELANTRLGFANLQSPLNGFILVKSAMPGEVTQIGSPVFTAIDLNNIWVTAYLAETDLAKVKLNQRADVKTDSYPNRVYKGWVSFISSEAEFTPKYIQTNEERVKYVYRIKVRVDNSSLDLKPGMPADAYIALE